MYHVTSCNPTADNAQGYLHVVSGPAFLNAIGAYTRQIRTDITYASLCGRQPTQDYLKPVRLLSFQPSIP